MTVTFDAAKRERTLTERGLDFRNAAEVFGGVTLRPRDDRFDYGEVRFQTYGLFRDHVVMLVWTARRRSAHHIDETLP